VTAELMPASDYGCQWRLSRPRIGSWFRGDFIYFRARAACRDHPI